LISADEFVQAVEVQIRQRPPLGALAMETRKLSMRQVFDVLSGQAGAQKPFGRVAVEMNYLTESELMELLGWQSERCPSLAEVIVDEGILDQATVNRELQRYRRAMMPDPVDARVSPTEDVKPIGERSRPTNRAQKPKPRRKVSAIRAKVAARAPKKRPATR